MKTAKIKFVVATYMAADTFYRAFLQLAPYIKELLVTDENSEAPDDYAMAAPAQYSWPRSLVEPTQDNMDNLYDWCNTLPSINSEILVPIIVGHFTIPFVGALYTRLQRSQKSVDGFYETRGVGACWHVFAVDSLSADDKALHRIGHLLPLPKARTWKPRVKFNGIPLGSYSALKQAIDTMTAKDCAAMDAFLQGKPFKDLPMDGKIEVIEED